MEINRATDTKNLLEAIFNIYNYLDDFGIEYSISPIEITEQTFENATGLKKLNLHKNHVKTLNVNMFKNMRKIEVFDASNNLIVRLDPKLFKGLTHLNRIDLSYNNIITIEKGTFDNLNLIKLILNYNNLTDFDFRSLNVSVIELFWNNLGDITSENNLINDLETQVLSIGYNQIPKLNSKFMKKFKKLENLSAQTNLIKYLESDTFKGMKNLKEIYLKENQITIIEKGTFYNLNLERLTLSSNKLIEFDFINLTAIEIDLTSNLITSLTINGNVEILNAGDNKISKIDVVTRTLKDLKTYNNEVDIQINYV